MYIIEKGGIELEQYTLDYNNFNDITEKELEYILGGKWRWKGFGQSTIGGAAGGGATGAYYGALGGTATVPGIGTVAGAFGCGAAGAIGGAAGYLVSGWW